jgi:hypothetical protein
MKPKTFLNFSLLCGLIPAGPVLSQIHSAYDGFSVSDYIDDATLGGQNGGVIDGNPGWAREIQAGTRIKSVNAGGLSYLDLQTTPGGTGGVFYNGSGFDAGFARNALYAEGPTKPGFVDTTLYGSMILSFGGGVAGAPVIPTFFGYDADGVDLTSGFNTSLIQIRNNSQTAHNQLRLMVPVGVEVDVTTNLDLSQPVFMVFEIGLHQDPGINDRITIYFNPSDLGDVAGTAIDTLTISEFDIGQDFIADWANAPMSGLYFKSGMRDNSIDEIRLAWGPDASIADVVPVPEPAAFALALAFGAALMIWQRKRPAR